MDESVRRALARWPDVPAVHGWLSLDRRGRWRLRGEILANRRAVEFIARNYAADAHGRWFFQNGPQRVYVALEGAPWVLSVDAAPGPPGSGGLRLRTHTGLAVRRVDAAWMNEDGALLLETEHGPGLVEDRDLATVADHLLDASGRPCDEAQVEALLGGADPGLVLALGEARLPVGLIAHGEAPRRFGYDPDPRPAGAGDETGIPMDFETFSAALDASTPPAGASDALAALWADRRGDWDRAHRYAQAHDGPDGAWVHAYLHRKEGDASNAAYWYRRASRPVCSTSLEEEWTAIARELTGRRAG